MGAEHFVLGRLGGGAQEVARLQSEVVERLVGAVDHVGPDVAGLAVGLAESAEGILAGAGSAVELVGVLAVIVTAEHAVAAGAEDGGDRSSLR